MKMVDIYKFDKFIDTWTDEYKHFAGDECMQALGFKSAKYNLLDGVWELSDEDYTWFILRWS